MKLYQKNDDGSYTEVEALTQDKVNEIVEDRLKREHSKYSDYEDIKNKSSEYESKIAELSKSNDDLASQLKTAKKDAFRNKLLSEYKINSEFAEFINGNDEDTMRSQAEKLVKGFGGGSVEINKKESSEGMKEPEDSRKQIAKSLFIKN